MEYILNIDENNKIPVFYFHKKITKNQKIFLEDLKHKFLQNNEILNLKLNKIVNENLNFLYEFPQTLDKDFLYCSLIFSLISFKILNKKVIILLNNSNKINFLFNYFYEIKKHFKNNNFRVISFFERKKICFNIEQLKKSNSLDFDSFCSNINFSKNDFNQKCPFFNNCFNNNFNNNFNNFDIEDYYNFLKNNQICGFYFNINNIINNNFDVILCELKDFFDYKKRINLQRLINFDKNFNDFFLVFDEVNNIDEFIKKNFYLKIDESCLKYARIELVKLYEIQNVIYNNMDIESNENKLLKPENEFLNFNLLCNLTENYSPLIKKNNHFLNILSNLLLFFINNELKKKKKNEEIFSIFKLKYDIFNELYISFKILNQFYHKLHSLFISINFFQPENNFFSENYHLIYFVLFLNYISFFSEFYDEKSFLLNLNNEKKCLELIFFQTENFIIKLNNLYKNNILFLSSGISNLNIFCKKYKINYFTLNDDYFLKFHKNNIFFTHTTNTSRTNETFYSKILQDICQKVPDGILVYFSNRKILEYFVWKWEDSNVFNYLLKYKMVFIEENKNEKENRESNLILNYKKCVNSGRGAIFLLTIRNNNVIEEFYGKYSKAIFFIGFPIETNINKLFNFKLQYYNNIFNITSEQMFNFDTFQIFLSKFVNKILNSKDKKIIVILNENLLIPKCEFLPEWIKNMIEFEEEINNIDDRIKLISNFLNDNNNET